MKLRKYVERAVLYCSILLFTIMIIGVLFQITVRNFFGFSINFLEELSMLLLSWFAFLAMSYTMSLHNHVLVDIFIRKLPDLTARICSIIIKAAMVCCILTIGVASLGLISRQMAIPMSLLPFRMGCLYFGLPAGSVLMTYFLFDDILRELRGLRQGREKS